jgi:hypothetical protein
MSVLPLHLQRKFEQRWAARFVAPAAPVVPKSSQLKRTLNTLRRPVKAKQKPAESSRRAQQGL